MIEKTLFTKKVSYNTIKKETVYRIYIKRRQLHKKIYIYEKNAHDIKVQSVKAGQRYDK